MDHANGVEPSSPGLPRSGYPGNPGGRENNPNGSDFAGWIDLTPVGEGLSEAEVQLEAV
jgi:hypothetical protein